MTDSEPSYRIALFDGPKDNDPKPVEIVWDDLVSELSSFKVTECREPDPERPKDGDCAGHHCEFKKIEAWSPADYADDSPRADTHVRAITLAVYDLDAPPLEAMVDLAGALEGVRYACHGTHASGSYRLVIPLSEPCAPADWPATWNLIRSHFKIPADPTCANLSRVYFFPSKPFGRGPGEIYVGQGAPLDLSWIRSLYASTPIPTPRAEAAKAPLAKPLPAPEIATTVNLVAIRKDLERVSRPESAEIVRRMLGTEALAAPGSRDETVNRAASILAAAPKVPPPADLAVEILRPSISLMDCAPEGLDHWLDKARYSYTRALNRRAAKDSRDARLASAIGRSLRRAAGADTPKEENEENFSDPEDDWRAGLLTVEDDDGEHLRQCGANANLILTHDENWKNFLAFNELSKEIDVRGGPLVGVSKSTLHIEAANWLSRSEYQLILKPIDVGQQLLAVARRNSVNPLRDYLLGCKQKWLESPRHPKLENFLTYYYGAKGEPTYLKEIGKKFLISAVARALQPGCFVKTVLVLEGAQDAGKSSSLQILGGEFFSDTKLDIHTRDGRMAASRFWIIELGELASIKRADTETVKTFLSGRRDDIRIPYAPGLESFLRTCVFVATTNESEYLTDTTGNTRYWPATVSNIDLEALKRDRDLIWGEAVAAFEEGERWWFEREETDGLQLAEKAAQERMRESPVLNFIITWFLGMAPERRPEMFSVEDVAVRALSLTPDRITEKVRMDVGAALSQLHFKKVRRRVDTIPVWRYELPEYMRSLPQETKPRATHLQVVQRMAEKG